MISYSPIAKGAVSAFDDFITFSETPPVPAIGTSALWFRPSTGELITILGEAVPTFSVAAVLSGSGVQGVALSVTSGTASNHPTYTYQWTKGGTNISGATSNSYTPVSGDVGAVITCVVTATNERGAATSTPTGITITSGSIVYDFAADSIGSEPANMTRLGTTFALKVYNASDFGGVSGVHCIAEAVATQYAGGIYEMTNISPTNNDQEIIFKKQANASFTQVGFTLRPQNTYCTGSGNDWNTFNQVPNYWTTLARNGYVFAIATNGTELAIVRFDAAGISAQLAVLSITDVNVWVRCRVVGSLLTMDTSPDGTTWTNRLSVTDTTYPNTGAGAKVQFINDAGWQGNTLAVSNITFT